MVVQGSGTSGLQIGQITTQTSGSSQLSPKVSLKQKIGVWVIFELAFAILPLVMNLLGSMGHRRPADWSALLGKGELLLVSVAIVATAVGHLLNREIATRLRGVRVLLVGVGFLLGCIGTGIYAQSIPVEGNLQTVDIGFVVASSAIIGPCAFVLSLVCLIVAEVD
ncbi:hypothetical protein [Actinosynnema sp. NPDC023587]|uniref:hypothetical protein n=1 Tax=Actinosynnema sp. NPDC023587 TaxID=3154695 RepID=UPI0033F06963